MFNFTSSIIMRLTVAHHLMGSWRLSVIVSDTLCIDLPGILNQLLCLIAVARQL